MYLFVTPGLYEVIFFQKVCKNSSINKYLILTYEERFSDKTDTVEFFYNKFIKDSINCTYNKQLAKELCIFYNMTPFEILTADCTLPKYITFKKSNSESILISAISRFLSILKKYKINCIYTGCSAELCRLIAYFIASRLKIDIYMHAYFGYKDRVVLFNNPIEYRLHKFASNYIPIDKSFIHLEPEYTNKWWLATLSQAFYKINSFYDLKPTRIRTFFKLFWGNRARHRRYQLLVNNGLLKKIDDINLIKGRKILLPLHLFYDFAMTVANRKFYHQFNIVRKIAKFLSDEGYTIIIKEHPADICGKKISAYNELFKNLKNIIFCDPYLDSTEILKKCDLMITFCSTYAIESYKNNIPVILLGNCFYKQFDFCFNVDDLTKSKLLNALNTIDQNAVAIMTKKFNSAMNILYKNSFNAPLPYLGNVQSDAVKQYTYIVNAIERERLKLNM